MATTGACPGTAIIQAAMGIESGPFVLLGGVLGAAVHMQTLPSSCSLDFETPARKDTLPTSPSHERKLDIDKRKMVLAYEVVCISIIALTPATKTGAFALLHPVVGGIVLGLAQAASVALRSRTIGVSMVFEDIGRCVWQDRWRGFSLQYLTPAVQFALGIFLASTVVAGSTPTASESFHVSALAAILGGAVMVFGARLAGGCPSGHGISGMAALSIGSMVSVSAMIAGGVGTAYVGSKTVGWESI